MIKFRKTGLVLIFSMLFVLVSCESTEKPVVLESSIRVPGTPAVAFEETDAPQTEKETFSETKAPVKKSVISFVAAGDNVIHPCIYTDAANRATADTREYNFKPTFEDISNYISTFDLAFINQETLMGGAELGYSGYPTFNSPQDLGYDLVEMGFDIIGISNNHMCDKGTAGIENTIKFWKKLESDYKITMIGGYSDEADFMTPRIIEIKGVKIAFVSYTYGTNGISLPETSKTYIPYIDDADIIRQCKAAKENADFLIASVHWGIENTNEISEQQIHTAQVFADNGADIIIGHHPHVLQKIDTVVSATGKNVPCIYSLGNFVSGMANWENMVGGLFSFDIVRDTDGSVYPDNLQFVPTVCFFGPSYYNSHIYFMSEYTDELASMHGVSNCYGNYNASVAEMKQYADKIMGSYNNYDINSASTAADVSHTE